MKHKKWAFLLVGLVLIVSAVIYFCRDTSTIPLDAENAISIDFHINPHDGHIYTITNAERVKEIIDTINGLDMREEKTQINNMSGNYYFFLINISDKSDKCVSVSLDDAAIRVDQETYKADTSDLLALLEQTYYDRKQMRID